MTKTRIVYLPPNTYTDTVEDYLLVYNPLSEKGVTVLNKSAAYLFKLIDNKKTLYELYLLAKEKDKNVKMSDIRKILDDFHRSEIIYYSYNKIKKRINFNNPRTLAVWFHITNQCNLRCKYCYLWKTSDKMSNSIARRAIKKILLNAKSHNFHEVAFKFSGGEALLELNMITDLVSYGRRLAVQIGIDIRFSILTNGVLISNKTAQIFKAYNLYVAVSLDGLGKYHNAQRIFADGSGTFNFVKKGINNLLSNKVRFNVMTTITSKNIKNIPKLTKYLLDNQIPFNFSFFRENACAQESLRADDEKLIKYLKKSYQMIFDNVPRYSVIDNILDRVKLRGPHLYTCGVGHSYLIVRTDGAVSSCPMIIDRIIGSIDDRDVINTMNDGNFIKPKGLTVDGKKNCTKCQWKYVCCGGCPILTYDQKGTYQIDSPYCKVYKALIPELLRIEAKRLITYGIKSANT